MQKDDPIELLDKESYKRVVVKMKAPLLNCLFMCCCYTQENAYKVYKWIPDDPESVMTIGKSGKRIMKLKEKSSLLMRCFTPASCRGYQTQFVAENTRRVSFVMNRNCKATFMCLGRPEISVYAITSKKKAADITQGDASEIQGLNQFKDEVEKLEETKKGDRQLIGRALLPFKCIGTGISIFDDETRHIYEIVGSAVQCQLFFFPTSFFPCREAIWEIYDKQLAKGDPVGFIYKRFSKCKKICCSTAPWYVIDFPPDIDWRKKLLIISAVQLLDQHYFEGWC